MPEIKVSSSALALLAALTSISIFSLSAEATPKVYFSGINTPSVYYSFDKNIPAPDLRFSLIASDSNASMNLAGAALVDPVSGNPYGVYQTGTQKGAYQFDISLDKVFAVRGADPFSFAPRVFETMVFNGAGESISFAIPLTIDYGIRQVRPIPASVLNVIRNRVRNGIPVDRVIGSAVVSGWASLNIVPEGMAADPFYMYIVGKKDLISTTPREHSCAAAVSLEYSSGRSFSQPSHFTNIQDCEGALNLMTEACAVFGGKLQARDTREYSEDYLKRTITCSEGNIYYGRFESSNGKVIEDYLLLRN